MVCCDLLAAFLALFWLKPVAKKTFLKGQELQKREEEAERAATAKRPDKPQKAFV